MTTKHTPGPWFVHATTDQYKLPVVVSREGRPVANDGQVVTRIVQMRTNLPIDQANARLIAAAPELLAALEKLSGLVEAAMLINHPQLCQERRDENAEAYEAARAAIAKASGNA